MNEIDWKPKKEIAWTTAKKRELKLIKSLERKG